MIKDSAKAVLCGLYKYSGALRLQEMLGRRSDRFLAILLFHRVTDDIPWDELTVSTDFFRRLCELLRRSFRVVPLAEIFRLVRAGERFPPRTLAITFDDCYRDNLFAARVLAEHELPACFFVPTAYVGTDHVFPWDRHLKQMPNLTWKEVGEMTELGHEIGSHTVTHADLAKVSVEQFERELRESKQTLEERLGRPVRWLAYPFGGPEHVLPERLPLVYQAGYDGCVSAINGVIREDTSDPILPRLAVPPFRSLLHLELRLRGGLNWLYDLKRRVGLF